MLVILFFDLFYYSYNANYKIDAIIINVFNVYNNVNWKSVVLNFICKYDFKS